MSCASIPPHSYLSYTPPFPSRSLLPPCERPSFGVRQELHRLSGFLIVSPLLLRRLSVLGTRAAATEAPSEQVAQVDQDEGRPGHEQGRDDRHGSQVTVGRCLMFIIGGFRPWFLLLRHLCCTVEQTFALFFFSFFLCLFLTYVLLYREWIFHLRLKYYS